MQKSYIVKRKVQDIGQLVVKVVNARWCRNVDREREEMVGNCKHKGSAATMEARLGGFVRTGT